MKEIKAVIRPDRLARLRQAFRAMPDFPGMTVVRAEGSGYHPRKREPRTLKSELTDASPRVRIEIVAAEAQVPALLAAIREACHTGQAGDGVAWVTPIDSFERLRTAR